VDLGRRDDAIADAVASVRAMVGMPDDLEVWVAAEGEQVIAIPGAPARLFLGAAWDSAEVDPAVLRFHVARALALLAGDRAHAGGNSARALPAAQLVAALFRAVVGLPPDAGGAPPDLPRRLINAARDRLADEPRWSEATPNPAAFVEGVRRTTDRIGLLASGDPRSAVRSLMATHGPVPGRAVEAWRTQEDVADLVRWTLGEDAARARGAMGLALGGDPA
jgi:hypothetical protein